MKSNACFAGSPLHRLEGYRRIFSRFEKLDTMFKAFISFVLIADLISVNTS